MTTLVDARPDSAVVGHGIDESDRLAHLVKDAGKALSRSLQSRLEGSVAYGHWTFLRILWKRDGISLTELSALAGVMTPSTFAAVKSMEALGYVERRQRSDNRKKVFVHLTPLGRALEQRLVPLAIEVNDIAWAGYSLDEVHRFRDMLIGVIRNLEKDRRGSSKRASR